MIKEDISTEFKNNYVGKYKNNLDNQNLFIAAVNSYFRKLTAEDVLDVNYDNRASVDVETQRTAWIDAGTAEAVDWKDQKVKQMTFGSNMYLAGQVKILDAIEDLDFTITMA